MLKYITLLQLENWSVQGLLDTKVSYNQKFSLARIGDFLTKSREVINIEDVIVYRRITVKINNGGLKQRDTEQGKNIGTKRQFIARAGQFIVSKIDARNGAMGIIPEELDGAIVTNDFPLFNVNKAKIHPQFLLLITTTKEFIDFAQSCSSGTTNRQRMEIDMFLNQKIPLPSLPEQERIVNAYIEKIEKSNEFHKLANKLAAEIEKYLHTELGVLFNNKNDDKKGKYLDFVNYQEIDRWALSHIFKNQLYSFKKVRYDVKPIKAILKSFDGGKTPSTINKEYWGGDINWFSAKDMKSLVLGKSEDFITPFALTDSGMKLHQAGTILGVFRSGILRHSFPVAILEEPATINQDLKAMKFDASLVIDKYALYYMNVFQKMILEQAQKVGVTVESLNTDEFLEVPFVLPPIAIQKTIVTRIENLKNNILDLKSKSDLLLKQASQGFENEIFGK